MLDKDIQELMQPNDGWKELIFPKEYGIGRSFVGGDESSKRLIVKYFIRKLDKRFFAKVYFGELAQGPPSHAHGGSMAAVLDEAMGLAAWAANHSVVAAKIAIEYVAMLPLDAVTIVETWVDKIVGRKVWMKAEIQNSDGKVFSKGEGLYVSLPVEKFGNEGFHHKMKQQIDTL
jgi:acyl-coenzyme A thioesterase PaaI-like protein